MVAACSGTDAGLELNACTISKLATEKRSGGWYYCEHKEARLHASFSSATAASCRRLLNRCENPFKGIGPCPLAACVLADFGADAPPPVMQVMRPHACEHQKCDNLGCHCLPGVWCLLTRDTEMLIFKFGLQKTRAVSSVSGGREARHAHKEIQFPVASDCRPAH